MKKLKTLKDIKLSYDYDTDCNLKEELKAEAIIWVKETKKYGDLNKQVSDEILHKLKVMVSSNIKEPITDEERKMFATITFKVKDKEEFKELKAVSQLPDEEWELMG